MASKKSTEERDEFGYKMPAQKTGSKTMRTIRSSGVDKTTGSRAGSSLRARGIEKGNTAGSLGSKTMRTARSSGAESKRSSKLNTPPQSVRAAGAKAKARNAASTAATRTARSSGAESKKATPRMGTLRSRGVEKGGIKGPNTTTPKLRGRSAQSLRAAGAKMEENKSKTSSFRSNRFGKGKVGASAPAGRNKNQSMRAAEYKRKNPGKY